MDRNSLLSGSEGSSSEDCRSEDSKRRFCSNGCGRVQVKDVRFQRQQWFWKPAEDGQGSIWREFVSESERSESDGKGSTVQRASKGSEKGCQLYTDWPSGKTG